MTTFNIGDVVAANIEGVFYKAHSVGEVFAVGADGKMTVRFSGGVKGGISNTQIVTAENFRLIPKV